MGEPKPKPIIFDGESVRTILAEEKDQTRRWCKQAPADAVSARVAGGVIEWTCADGSIFLTKPRFAVGQTLWVKERWSVLPQVDEMPIREMPHDALIRYAADAAVPRAPGHRENPGVSQFTHPRSPLYMPRWASRLTLRVTSVRVERVQDISEADAIAEGVRRMPETQLRMYTMAHERPEVAYVDGRINAPKPWTASARESFEGRWQAINALRAPWDSNPWVEAVTFEVVPHA